MRCSHLLVCGALYLFSRVCVWRFVACLVCVCTGVCMCVCVVIFCVSGATRRKYVLDRVTPLIQSFIMMEAVAREKIMKQEKVDARVYGRVLESLKFTIISNSAAITRKLTG